MLGKLDRFIIIGIIGILLGSATINSTIFLCDIAEDNDDSEEFGISQLQLPNAGPSSRGGSRWGGVGTVSVMNLLKNSQVSQVSDWELINATQVKPQVVESEVHINAKYDSDISPTQLEYEMDIGFLPEETPFHNGAVTHLSEQLARINQTFNKSFWTPKIPSAVVLTFNYELVEYDFEINTKQVEGDLLLEIKNKGTGVWGHWPLEKGKAPGVVIGDGSFLNGQTRNKAMTVNVGGTPSGFSGPNPGTSSFDISAPGNYEVSLIVQFRSTGGTTNISDIDYNAFRMNFDNIYIKINDTGVPWMVAEQTNFGPLTNDTYNASAGLIDVDFYHDDPNIVNSPETRLKVGQYRLNNTTPGSWHTIFQNQLSYTDDWLIEDEWQNMSEGVNTFDLYCEDEVGNWNASLQITVFKDTAHPNSNTSTLDEYYATPTISIPYKSNDPGGNTGKSGGFNNTVKLFYRYEESGQYKKYSTLTNPGGFFNESPIQFSTVFADGEGKYEFYTIGIDNGSNQEPAPTNPDTSTIIDFTEPTSEVSELPEYKTNITFDIEYTASDPVSGVNHTELWYKVGESNNWYQWVGSSRAGGNFTSSPISFTAPSDGVYYFLTISYDKAGNVESPGIPSQETVHDAWTQVDSQAPKPIFLTPVKQYIRGTEIVNVTSDFDTESVELFYWLDIDGDGIANNINDIESTWIFIKSMSYDLESGNWSYDWDTMAFTELTLAEYWVILKAVGEDVHDKGEGFKSNIQVDNIEPKVIINDPKTRTAENGATLLINYTTADDVQLANFYYRDHSEHSKKPWIPIAESVTHPNGSTNNTYEWALPVSFRANSPTIDIKVGNIDDAGNIGEAIVEEIYINSQGPEILPGFPTDIVWDEDFGEKYQKFTEFESHTDKSILGDNLKWYVTENSDEIFIITGDNSSGEVADTFNFNSIQDMYGTETLTFHLTDPKDLEATITQTIIVNPVNDAPVLNIPKDPIHIFAGAPDTYDFSLYIYDVDNNQSELTLTTDKMDITVSGLKLNFNYGADRKDDTEYVKLTVTDGILSTDADVVFLLSDNHRPELIKEFPTDLVLESGEELKDSIDLDDHFDDPDGDPLTYTYEVDNVDVMIIDGKVTLEAHDNVDGKEEIWFTAKDPLGAFAKGLLIITIEDINDKPWIRDIPDIFVHTYKASEPDSAYEYDFSYFLYDPDNDRDELLIYASPATMGAEEAWIQEHPTYNTWLIFKFPFEAYQASPTHKHSYYLNVEDPDHEPAWKLFNVTVILDSWPVEQIEPLPDQKFFEKPGNPDHRNDAFDLDEFFNDDDKSGTNYQILSNTQAKINAEIDGDNNVDLSSKDPDWNGVEEVVIVAIDNNPQQYIYAVVMVEVYPVNDPPVLAELPEITVNVSEGKKLYLNDYLTDVDNQLDDLKITSSDQEHVTVSGFLLAINFDKAGKKNVTITINDGSGGTDSKTMIINVKAKEETATTDSSILVFSVIGLVIVIIVILVVLMVMFTAYKVKEVFLIHQSGILLSHLSHEKTQNRDEEILSGMFTAVQEFIKDSFSSNIRPGSPDSGNEYVLREMKIGEHNNRS